MSWLTKVFGKPETRSSYTDLRIQAAWQNAEGGGYVGDVRLTAELEAVCRLYQAVFSVAEVKGPPWLQRALTATWRAQAVRAMLRGGEHLDVIESGPGGVELVPAAAWTILGGPRPSSWSYLTTLDGPSGTLTRPYEADDVLHVRWSTERGRAWEGVGPMQAARSTGQLVGGLETRQGEEVSSPVGMIIPMQRADGDDPESEDDPLMLLRNDIKTSRGRTLLPETQMGSGDPAQRPHADWKSVRFGGAIPEQHIDLRTKVGMSVASACGVPVSLVEALATGIGQRQAWQRFTQSSCAAAWAVIADEVEAKMGVRPELDLSPAYGAGLDARSQAYSRLVGEGKLSSAEALKVVGLK